MRKFFLSGLAVAALFFTACSSDDDGSGPSTDDDGGETSLYDEDGNWLDTTITEFEEKFTEDADATGADESVFDWTIAKGGVNLDDLVTAGAEVLSGDISEDRVLDADKVYELQGPVFVREDVTLTIPAGTWIFSDPTNNSGGSGDVDASDVLIVEQGAKLMAEGTAEAPIVFTANEKTAGAWGGIVILGKAPINLDSETGVAEVSDNAGEDLVYGGSDENDNSGSLKYVTMAYSGDQINTESEYNGFSFYGVGKGTTLENLEVHRGKDDGYEWFGGTVDAKNLYSNAFDDSFDWTEGWTGSIENIVAEQTVIENAEDEDQISDNCIEADNLSADHDASPRSHPKIKDATFYAFGANKSVVTLRRGTSVDIENLKIDTSDNINDGIVTFRIDDLLTAELILDETTSVKGVKFPEGVTKFGGNANE